MKNAYKIAGMTCRACTQSVREALLKVADVKAVNVDLATARAEVEAERPIPLKSLKEALTGTLYQINEQNDPTIEEDMFAPDEASERNEKLVSGYIQAVGKLEYQRLPDYLDPDFKYNGAVNYDSARDFIKMIQEHATSPIADSLLGHDIKAIFAEEDECCVIYDSVTRFSKVPFVEWIKVKDGKIVSTEVKFNRYRMKRLMQEMRRG